MSALVTNGIYRHRKGALELAAMIAAETGERTRVQQLAGNPRLWEIVWAAEEDTNG